MSKKKQILITLDDSDFELIKNFRERVYDALPRGKKTIPSVVAKAMGVSTRVALVALSQLEDEGLLTSERGTVKFEKSSSRCRIFTKL